MLIRGTPASGVSDSLSGFVVAVECAASQRRRRRSYRLNDVIEKQTDKRHHAGVGQNEALAQSGQGGEIAVGELVE